MLPVSEAKSQFLVRFLGEKIQVDQGETDLFRVKEALYP
jgi:hypothetical protein